MSSSDLATTAKTSTRKSTTRDPAWRAAVSNWAKEQAAAAPPLNEETVRIVRGAFDRPPDYPTRWDDPATAPERQAG